MMGVLLFLSLLIPSQTSEMATVYVYMPHHTFTSGRFSGKFYVDDKKTAEINKNRYFVLHLPTGSHSFYVREKKLGGLTMQFASGQTYYLRVNAEEGGFRMRFRGISLVSKEEVEFIIKEIKPIKKKDVYDPTYVDMKVVSP